MSTPSTVSRAGLIVDSTLATFVDDELLPPIGIDVAGFWEGVAEIFSDLTPRNLDLLERREEMQSAIDAWHKDRRGGHDAAAYRTFLEELGYLQPEGPAFTVGTAGVTAELASVAGPQLVVPAMNARYAINAANARWGSLYDALYGTDALGSEPPEGPYDADRGARVVTWAKAHLDLVVPLDGMSHAEVTRYRIVGGELSAEVIGGERSTSGAALVDPGQCIGWSGPEDDPESIHLMRNGLGIILELDRDDEIGAVDPAGLADVTLEAAVTAIIDCEDSVAAIDGDDKVVAFRNWAGLCAGTLTEEVHKAGRTFTRSMNDDRKFNSSDGTYRLPGRAVMLVRNVGHLMTTPAIRSSSHDELPEGIGDAIFTVAGAMHGLAGRGQRRNGSTDAVYLVKPKMHGADEAAFTNTLLDRVEDLLGLSRNTVKVGVMDEERRTTLNLHECIRAVRDRVVFINTGFLDRTGDEMHTSMEAGPMVRKADMKAQGWISAYEDWNVDVGLRTGLAGVGQIGKGMWAAPDRMEQMLAEKLGHPTSGASCAWVPSPTAATLHATHYHRVDVADVQRSLRESGPRRTIDELLAVPVAADVAWSDDEIQAELDNNAQGILGYVVRWVDQGVGCSKVPDIHDVGLMEDRATCRISSQHIANWLHHGVVDVGRVRSTFERMAAVVDRQNADDESYEPMAPSYGGHAYLAALDLVLSGTEQPSGYTEPILHARRAERKRELASRNGTS